MIRLAALVLFYLAIIGRLTAQLPGPSSPAGDTVPAGDAVVDAGRLHPFSLMRHLTMTRGDTVKPFGRQSERLTSATRDGQPVWLDVLTFETPNATTVDSSWTDARTLRPLRMLSSNKERVVSLEFEGPRVRGGVVPSTARPPIWTLAWTYRPSNGTRSASPSRRSRSSQGTGS